MKKRAFYVLVGAIVLSPTVSSAVTLTGTVVDASQSTPIPAASVAVDVLIPDSITFTTQSDASGAYSLSNIPGSNAIYVIRCYVPGFANLYMRYDALGLGDRQVDILMYPSVVPPGGGGDSSTVSGIVLHETAGGARNPVELAKVTLTRGTNEFFSTTGADGKYSLRLPRASYALTVEAPSYLTLTAGGIAVDSAGLVLNVLLNPVAIGIPPDTERRPAMFVLENAYPNPFNPSTVIGYQLPVSSEVRIVVLDLLGNEVAVLVNERKAAGRHEVRFDGSGLSSGAYFCRLAAEGFAKVRKLLLAK